MADRPFKPHPVRACTSATCLCVCGGGVEDATFHNLLPVLSLPDLHIPGLYGSQRSRKVAASVSVLASVNKHVCQILKHPDTRMESSGLSFAILLLVMYLYY